MAKKFGNTYVICRVEPGMFKDEWLAYVDAIDPQDRRPARVQLFVDVRDVRSVQGTPRRNEPASAWLRVTVADERGDFARIVLPQPSTPFGENIIVSREHLENFPAS